MKLYTRTGEWIAIDGDVGRVGVVSQVATAIGEIIYVMFPGIGHNVSKGQLTASLESQDGVWSVHAPVSGRVLGINEQLRDIPSMIASNSEDQAWIFDIKLSKPKQTEKLLCYEDLLQLIEHSEADHGKGQPS